MIFLPRKARVRAQSMLQSLVGYFSRMTGGSLLGSFNLPVSIQTNEGLSWSDDGKLAIVTKKGVYVFEITPNARGPGGPKARITKNTINFVKTFVEADVSGSPWQLDNLLTEEDLAALPRSLRTEVLLDRLICPHLAAAGEHSEHHQTFRQHSKVGQAGSQCRSQNPREVLTLRGF